MARQAKRVKSDHLSVFISSTGLDLGDYRKTAFHICEEFGFFPNGMESWEAMELGATEGSIEKLKDADLYVGIFAHRYGYIERVHYSKSVTEMEFDNAAHLDKLCFFVDESYPWKPEYVDGGINKKRLESFKGRIKKETILATFTTVDDFAVKLSRALLSWRERHNAPTSKDRGRLSETSTIFGLMPPRPGLVKGRENDITMLKQRLGIAQPSSLLKARTIIRGWPGVGKTTLVTSLAHDSDIEKAFPDGVLWARLGENANILSELMVWGRALNIGGIEKAKTQDEVTGRLGAALRGKRMLLIIDDVWKSEDALPFFVGGNGCAHLLTTRFPLIANDLKVETGDIYVLSGLNDNDAFDLFECLAQTVAQKHKRECQELIKDWENLPLAIRVAAGALEDEATIDINKVDKLIHDLKYSYSLLDQKVRDQIDPTTGTKPTVNLLLKKSIDRLDNITQAQFIYLTLFAPKPASFDLDAIKAAWSMVRPLPAVRKLVNLGLLEVTPSYGVFQIHALLVMYGKSLVRK